MDDVVDAEVIAEEPTQPEQPEPEVPQFEAAFTVVLNDGRWMATTDLLNKPVAVVRPTNVHDMYHAACTIERDIAGATTVDQLLQVQKQMAEKLAEQAKNKAIAEDVLGQGAFDLSKLRQQ